jgi:chromosome segregation ATPase
MALDKTNLTRRLSDAAIDLERMSKAWAEADQAERMARNRTTDARNKLNEAQKALDQIYAEMRQAAPSGSDWKAHRHIGYTEPHGDGP